MTPSQMAILPLPKELQAAADILGRWAVTQRHVLTVYLYGSRVSGSHRPDSDLDVAVGLRRDEEGDALATFMFEKACWTKQLNERLPFDVHLELADPDDTPCVWSYLNNGCVVVYQAG